MQKNAGFFSFMRGIEEMQWGVDSKGISYVGAVGYLPASYGVKIFHQSLRFRRPGDTYLSITDVDGNIHTYTPGPSTTPTLPEPKHKHAKAPGPSKGALRRMRRKRRVAGQKAEA
jgi:hypothetical protein